MNSNNQANNKRIAKNTLYLYLRMILVMLVGLYSSRIILQMLGVSDYGIYDVLGGIIGMLGYVNTLLAGGTSRFLTICLGEGNPDKLRLTFSTTVGLTMFSSLLVIILGETVGLWFINNYLNIDSNRMEAANWVYQSALISSALTITQSPFTATIISHEKMNVYAYLSIFDVVLKFALLYFLVVIDYDKLVLYSILMLIVNFLNIVINRSYCIRNFDECSFSFRLDRSIFKQMFSYSGWNMLGSLSSVLMNQGVTIVLNIFFGTVVNAAKGISNQVCSLARQLYSNFQLAAKPQIMKYYAKQEYKEMFELMINTSKYCAFLLLCVLVPIFVNVEGLLNIWLTDVPDYSVEFIRLTLLYTLFRAIDEPLTVGIHAVGRMKLPNLTTAVINMAVFPLTWIICKYGGNPIMANVIIVIVAPLILTLDLWILKKYIDFPVWEFIRNSLLPVLIMFIATLLIPATTLYLLPEGIGYCLLNCLFSLGFVLFLIYRFAIPESMRNQILVFLKTKVGK